MPPLFHELPANIAKCFRGRNLLWHLLAIALTWGILASGLDWLYFASLRNTAVYPFLFPAAIIGGLLPMLAPVAVFIAGLVRKNLRTLNAAWAMGQAAIIGSVVSSFYKFFTGRVQPPQLLTATTTPDVSWGFRFGLDKGGIFWGWPSSHTTIAFAVSVTLVLLYPESKWIKYLALVYAAYVGLGVSVSIHWFSDVVAGVIMGTIIGIVVGRSFLKRYAAGKGRPA
jgi:membrane-associated phospholipid phosphatase